MFYVCFCNNTVQEGDIEKLLRPLESRCFTYLPTTWTEGNETLESPFTFQWCHKGRATILVQHDRMRTVRS